MCQCETKPPLIGFQVPGHLYYVDLRNSACLWFILLFYSGYSKNFYFSPINKSLGHFNEVYIMLGKLERNHNRAWRLGLEREGVLREYCT